MSQVRHKSCYFLGLTNISYCTEALRCSGALKIKPKKFCFLDGYGTDKTNKRKTLPEIDNYINKICNVKCKNIWEEHNVNPQGDRKWGKVFVTGDKKRNNALDLEVSKGLKANTCFCRESGAHIRLYTQDWFISILLIYQRLNPS